MKRRAGLLMGICAAVFAITGGSASLAAATPTFETGRYTSVVEGAQIPGGELTFDFGGAKASCEKAELVAVLAEPETEIDVGLIFAGCTAFGFTGATIEMGGCQYGMTAGELTQPFHHLANVDLDCFGGSIKISASTCEVQVGAQEGLAGFELINEPLAKPRKSVTLVTDVKGLTYTTTNDGPLCPLAGVGTFNDGKITGVQALTANRGGDGSTKLNVAVNDEPPPQPLFEAAEYPPVVEANQVAGKAVTFNLGGAEASCEFAEFAGVISGPEASITMGPIFTGCTAFGFTGATIDGGGCDLILTVGEEFQAVHHLATGDLRCIGERKMTIKASTCEVQIGGQQGLGEFELINRPALNTPSKTVKLISNVQRLAYTTTKDGFLCPLQGIGSFNDGTITGTQRMVAERSVTASKLDFSVSTEPPAPPALEASRYVAALNGVQQERLTFSIEGNTVECEVAGLSGTLSGPASIVLLHPTFSDCVVFGSGGATVDTTGCDFVLEVGEETSVQGHGGKFGINCPGTNRIRMVAGTCEVTIGSQRGLGRIDLTDNQEADLRKNVSIRYVVTKLTATAVKDGFLCPLGGVGTKIAALTGRHKLSAAKPGDPNQTLDLSVSDNLPPLPFIEAGRYPAPLNAVQSQTLALSIDTSDVTCKTAALSGSLPRPGSTLTLHPTFSDCVAFGFTGSTVDTTGCDFVLRLGEEIEAQRHDATLDLVCSGSSGLKIVANTCEVEVPSQQNLGKVVLTDNPKLTPPNLSVRYNVNKITATALKDGFLCPLSGVGVKSGILTGLQTLSAGATRPTQLLVREG